MYLKKYVENSVQVEIKFKKKSVFWYIRQFRKIDSPMFQYKCCIHLTCCYVFYLQNCIIHVCWYLISL